MDLTALWEPVEVERSVRVDPERVFATLSDPTTYPEWLVGAQRIRQVDTDFPAPGSAFHHSVGPSEEATVDDRTEAVDVEDDHDRKELVLRVHAGLFDGLVQFVVRPHGEGAHVVLREVPLGPLRLLTPAFRLPLRARNIRSLQQLGQLLEIEEPAAAAAKEA